eukprot:GEMP01013567.1.p1 GENE.GEMP01013567.1~~GEMP01013567.1.p1  ORF type:complete len:836 (+),score=150.07 GEMP01013567.1:85-2592(+)
MRFQYALSAWILLVKVPVTWSDGTACLWNDFFGTCQISYNFLSAQGLPKAMDVILENVKNDNECVTSGCPPWKCTFSDKVGRCVSLKTRWILEMDVPQFTQFYEGTCNIYTDQNLLGGFSSCLAVSTAAECEERGRFCYLQPLWQRNMTGPTALLGTDPCHNFRSICLPKIETSECAHCWRRAEECFRNCDPLQKHVQAMRDAAACKMSYREPEPCSKNISCYWTSGKCDVRFGGYLRAFEDACPLKALFTVDGIALRRKCENNAEFACDEDPDCLWKLGPIMPNGYCPVVGEWQERPKSGYCLVDERILAQQIMTDQRVVTALRYYIDKLWSCEAIRDKAQCTQASWDALPPVETVSSLDTEEDYVALAIIVMCALLGGFVCFISTCLLGRKLLQVLEDEPSRASSKSSGGKLILLLNLICRQRRRKITPTASRFKFKTNEARGRPTTERVSVEATNITIDESTRKPFIIDFQVATDEEDGDDELLGARSGIFYSSERNGKWRLRENCLQLDFESSVGENSFAFLATPTQGETVWLSETDDSVLKVLYPKKLPEWLAPAVLSDRREVASVSQEYFECPACFFDLYIAPVGVIKKHSKRVCPHYIHVECGKAMIKDADRFGTSPACLYCGMEFSDVKLVPDLLKEPSAWFAVCDIDFSGTLDKREVEDALGAVLPFDRMKLKRAITKRWATWDPDGDGFLSYNEFMEPEGGLRSFALKHLTVMMKDSFGGGHQNIPDLETHPHEWFEFWDKDCSNTLEQDELIRAMVKTFCLTAWGDPILSMAREMKSLGKIMWRDLGYDDDAQVPFEEFVLPCGLADCFVHNEIHCRHFGEGSA